MLSVPQSGCESDFYQLHQSTLAIFGSLSQRILNSSANHQQNSANFLSPNGLKSRSKTCFWRHHDWDSGRLDLRAPDISRAQDQPYTPRPAVMIVGLHPPGWSECECLTASFKYIKMWDVVFWTWGSSAKRFQDIRFLHRFLLGSRAKKLPKMAQPITAVNQWTQNGLFLLSFPSLFGGGVVWIMILMILWSGPYLAEKNKS